MLALIPARSGSKGLPGKNIKMLLGKPLLVYAIEAAQQAKSIDRIVVSTDDEQIAEVARQYDAEVPFLRPAELATDNASAIDVYLYTIDQLSKLERRSIEEFVVLQPTSPLRQAADIDRAIEIFYARQADMVVSFYQTSHPPVWAKRIENDKISDYFTFDPGISNRQKLPSAFMPNGAVYVINVTVLREKRTYYTDRTIPYVMPEERSVDIDTEADFKYAEFLIRQRYAEVKGEEKLSRYQIDFQASIKEAVKQLDEGGIGFVAVIDQEQKVVGVFTDGDFRRAVLAGRDLEDGICTIMNQRFVSLPVGFTSHDIDVCFGQQPIDHIPVLQEGRLVEIVAKSHGRFGGATSSQKANLDVPVVIMAGGKGTRLEPFTQILPKALIPIGEKSIIELIMDEYAIYGVQEFIVSVNCKSKIIRAYFEEAELPYRISFIEETKPLGTAGALSLLHKVPNRPFFVSNCDIIIKNNYAEIYDFHCSGGYELTLVASMQHHTVPYGVCEIELGGNLKHLKEKPEYDFLVNTGMYVLNPEVISLVPGNEFCHITEIIECLQTQGMSVGVFPISEKSWIDVGQWNAYRQAIKNIQY